MAKVNVLREMNAPGRTAALLEAEGSSIHSEPLLMQSLAQVLLPLPHRQAEADWLLRRSMRNRPTAAAGYFLLGTQWWEDRRFEDAAEMYRFACTLEEREDQFADAYFRAARDRTGAGSGATVPATSRSSRGADPGRAPRSLPRAHGPRRAGAGVRRARSGDQPRRGRLPPSVVRSRRLANCCCSVPSVMPGSAERPRRTPICVGETARHSRRPGRKPRRGSPACRRTSAAGLHTLEFLKLEPTSPKGTAAPSALLAETDGRAAARIHLAQACQRFPHHYPLLKLRAEFLSGDPDADADRVLQDMLEECPDDAWACGSGRWSSPTASSTPRPLRPSAGPANSSPGTRGTTPCWRRSTAGPTGTEEALAAVREGLRREHRPGTAHHRTGAAQPRRRGEARGAGVRRRRAPPPAAHRRGAGRVRRPVRTRSFTEPPTTTSNCSKR